ncbi:MAG: flagellar protein FliT [Rhodocyclales bacterium]|nr:flagellar protein FliT [Rhodocyclales bacterium]
MPAQLDRYEEISALSARMVAAARRGDWDGLVDLERHVAALRDGLVAEAAAPTGSSYAVPETVRMRGLIQQILDDDAEVRRHTEPWMEQVRQLLSGHLSNWQVPGNDNVAETGNKHGVGP